MRQHNKYRTIDTNEPCPYPGMSRREMEEYEELCEKVHGQRAGFSYMLLFLSAVTGVLLCTSAVVILRGWLG